VKYIFTKRFSALSSNDQAAAVDAAIRDLEAAIGKGHPEDERRIRRAIKRIEKKAVEYGVYWEVVKS